MAADKQHYSSLTRLRGELARLQAAGDDRNAANVAAAINELTAVAERDAREHLRRREETKRRFQELNAQIRRFKWYLTGVESANHRAQDDSEEEASPPAIARSRSNVAS